MSEKTEALMRIVVGLISGLILGLWKVVIQVVTVIHFFYVLFTGKRDKELAKFCNMWVTFAYTFVRYMTFTTNKRPFPFNSLGKNIEKIEIEN